MEVEDDGHMKVVSARGGTLTSWGGARVDNRLSHPALVDKVMTLYLQNDNIVNKEIDKTLIRKAINDYILELENNPELTSLEAKRKFITMSSWVLRSTSGSIFIDDEDNVYPGTIRVWLSDKGIKLERYGTRTAKKSKSLDNFASLLFPDSKLGDPDVIEKLTTVGAIKYFDEAITVEDYQSIGKQPEQVGDVKFKQVAKMKISNLSESARLHVDNNSILRMTEDEVNDVYNQINMEEYVDLIANFAEVWQNKLQVS